MEAFMRSGAVQGYFGRNASQLHLPEGRCLQLFDRLDTPGDILLSNLCVTRLRSYALQSTPFPTVFLFPALMGFTVAGGTVLQTVPLPGTANMSWIELGTTFPLLIYGLTRSGTSNFSAVYAGQLTPPGVNIHTYTDAELGTGWLIPEALMDGLDVLVPKDWVLAATLEQAISRVPTLTERFQAPGNSSSKKIFMQEDGRDSWDIYVADRPTAAQVASSRVMYRAMAKDRFADILNATRSLDLDTERWHARLLMYSVLSPWEVPVHCASMAGLYNSKIRFMRIMRCPEALTLLYGGKWPQSFQLHVLSLWHFMPTQSLGFDYTKSNGDIFTALRGFLMWWSWLSGITSIPSVFEPDIMIWQTTHPWASRYVWVINVCIEKGLAAWFLYMSSPAEVFAYKDDSTAVQALIKFLRDNLAVDSVNQGVRDAYDAQYAPMVVYPDAHCSVPNEVPSIRCRALLDPQGLTEPQYVLPEDVAAFNSLSVSQGNPKRQKVVVSPGEEKAPPGVVVPGVLGSERTRVCFANLAHVFDITMKTTYAGKCTGASASGPCPAGTHYTKGARPSATAALKSIEGYASTKYGKELRAGLVKANA